LTSCAAWWILNHNNPDILGRKEVILVNRYKITLLKHFGCSASYVKRMSNKQAERMVRKLRKSRPVEVVYKGG